MTSKEKTINIDPEYGVDSRYKTPKEKAIDAVALMEARLERMKNLPKEQILKAELLQLRLKIENYLRDPDYDNKNDFAHFLELYVDTIYSKRSEFAEDINVTPVFLSKVINKHREPKDEFILKLMIHSEKVFKNWGDFPKELWYQVYFHEKLSNTMSSQHKWSAKLEEQVKVSPTIVK